MLMYVTMLRSPCPGEVLLLPKRGTLSIVVSIAQDNDGERGTDTFLDLNGWIANADVEPTLQGRTLPQWAQAWELLCTP